MGRAMRLKQKKEKSDMNSKLLTCQKGSIDYNYLDISSHFRVRA